MLKFITVLFLTAQVALILGIITKDDLPEEIQTCLDNVIIPRIRLQASCKKSNNENAECRTNEGEEVLTSNSKCLMKIDELKRTEHKFVRAYMTNEYIKIMYDFSSEIPENVRDCMDSMKPIMQADFQRGKDCEAFTATDNPETPDLYQECLEKIPDLFQHPQSVKCIKISESLTQKQKKFLEPYMFKVMFDF